MSLFQQHRKCPAARWLGIVCLSWGVLSASVSRAQEPVEAASSARNPTILLTTNFADGSLDIAWRSKQGDLYLSHYSGKAWEFTSHQKLGRQYDLGLLGGLANDDRGNRYLLTAKKEVASGPAATRGYSPGVVQIVHVPLSPEDPPRVLADLNSQQYSAQQFYNPIVGPEGAGTAILVQKQGILVPMLTHSHRWTGFEFSKRATLLAVETSGRSVYRKAGIVTAQERSRNESAEIIDLRVSAASGEFMSIATARVRSGTVALGMSLLKSDGSGIDRFTWTEPRSVFAPGPGTTPQRMRIAGIQPTSYGHAIVFTYGEGPPRDTLGEFEDGGSKMDLYLAKVPTAENAKVEIVKLVDVGRMNNRTVRRARFIALGRDGRYVIAYELWNRDSISGLNGRTLGVPSSEGGSFIETQFIDMDENGSFRNAGPLKNPQGAIRIQRGNNMIRLRRGDAAWVFGEKDKLVLMKVSDGIGRIPLPTR